MGEISKAKEKILFVSCNVKKKQGREVGKKYFFALSFLVKNVCFMHVLHWFVGIFLNKNLLG